MGVSNAGPAGWAETEPELLGLTCGWQSPAPGLPGRGGVCLTGVFI